MLRTAMVAALAFGAVSAPAWAQEDGPVIKEWPVEWADTRPRDPFAASEDEVWFVGQRGHYLGHLDVDAGEITKIDLPDGAGPHNAIVASDGKVWYTGNLVANIGVYDPETKDIEIIPMPDETARDPHTLVEDDAGNIWFTVQGGNMMGRVVMETRQVDLIPSQTERSRPYGIKIAPDGTPWVVLFGSNELAKINPETLEATQIAIPRESARPRRIEITTDGRIWYGDYADGKLGVYDPQSEEFTEWDLPSGDGARPYGMARDKRDIVWAVETGVQPNMLVGFDSKAERFVPSAAIPSGGRTVRHMHYLEESDEIWFGADTNTIGRIELED